MNLANQLTMLRMGLALAMFFALLRPEPGWHLAAFFLFLAAILTDWFDGWVARMTHTISAFGKVADPIADKILVIGAFIALIRRRELSIPLWGVFLIIARELVIGGIRILASAQGKLPAAQSWGKLKMGVQSVSVLAILGILVLQEHWAACPAWLSGLPYYLTLLCVAVAWNSAYRYYRQSRQVLKKSWS